MIRTRFFRYLFAAGIARSPEREGCDMEIFKSTHQMVSVTCLSIDRPLFKRLIGHKRQQAAAGFVITPSSTLPRFAFSIFKKNFGNNPVTLLVVNDVHTFLGQIVVRQALRLFGASINSK